MDERRTVMPRTDRDKLPFRKLLPNLVTILGLCAGLTSIRFAMGGEFQAAALLIIFAALIDGMDGMLARRLKATSELGAELDSLSDFLNFGVAPGLLVFGYLLGEAEGGGWIFVLVFTICCCLRLARFNITKAAEDAGEQQPQPHFVGVPAPAGALLALLPVFLGFQDVRAVPEAPVLTSAWLGLVGALMVSRLPTFSPKSVYIPRDKIVWLLIATAIVIGGFLTQFWISMILIDVVYVGLLVRSTVLLARARRR
jgi:CDP-diacylglycerol--serine O-phosphatidyltransferase